MATTSGLSDMNHPARAMPTIWTRARPPIQMAAGMTLVRCSIWVAPKIGEITLPTCCRARPRPTMVLDPEIMCR